MMKVAQVLTGTAPEVAAPAVQAGLSGQVPESDVVHEEPLSAVQQTVVAPVVQERAEVVRQFAVVEVIEEGPFAPAAPWELVHV